MKSGQWCKEWRQRKPTVDEILDSRSYDCAAQTPTAESRNCETGGKKADRCREAVLCDWKEGNSVFLPVYTMESSEGGRASALQQRLQARREMFLKSESSPAQATPSAQVLEVYLFFNQWRNKSWVLKKTQYIARWGSQVMKICTWTKFFTFISCCN